MSDIGFVHKGSIRNFQKKKLRQFMFPIFSGQPDAYQMDTLFNLNNEGKTPYFLVLINVNTRKGYAYPMESKDAIHVYNALQKFLNDVNYQVSTITTDQDPAYIETQNLALLKVYNINLYRTSNNDHNKLGIINRFIRTLRDLNREPLFTLERMRRCIEVYNKRKHRSTGIAPNDFKSKDEKDYIRKKWRETMVIRSAALINPNSHVRILEDKNVFGKTRYTFRPEYVKVVGIDKNQIQVMSKNQNVEKYPRYKLMVDDNPNLPAQESINKGNRVGIEKILDHQGKRYKVQFEDGTIQWVTKLNLREDNPTRKTQLEKEYWSKNKKLRK